RVEHVQRDRFVLEIAHDDVGDAHVLDDVAPAARRLDADAPLGVLEDAVRYGDAARAARHLAADRDAAVAAHHRAVGDGHVLDRPADLPALRVAPRLDRDAVVAGAEVRVRDVHVARRFGIDAVGVGRILGIVDPDAADVDAVAVDR